MGDQADPVTANARANLVWDVATQKWLRMTQPAGLAYYITAYEFDGSGNPVYSGQAVAGSSKAASVWQIKKYVFAAGNLTDIQFANSDSGFSYVWNNRASYTFG